MNGTLFTLCVLSLIAFSSSSLVNDISPKNVNKTPSTLDDIKIEKEIQPESHYEMKKNTSISDNITCQAHSMEDFPEDLFTVDARRHGAVLLHMFCGVYCFMLTAYVCNDYLLPALDLICSGLRISPNVAGATFLATASCFPELFVNVVGTFITESDLGVGAVVGGAVFNTFATPAFGALSAAQGIQLEWSILSRDCIIYIVSVSMLVVVMWDGIVTGYEATVLMVLFTAYFTFLFLHDALIRWLHKMKNAFHKKSMIAPDTAQNHLEYDNMPNGLYKPFVHGELIVEYRNSMRMAKKLKIMENGNHPKIVEDLSPMEEYIEPDFPFKRPAGGTIWKNIWFIFTWPIKIVLFLTIPNCGYKKLRNWYPITFLICVMWIATSSYLVSWMVTVVGATLGVGDAIMGFTFLAAGGNMPELVSIVILSRKGNGDMAMSNTLGSNTLDVLLCLGLPWMIRTVMMGKSVHIESGALAYSVISIIVCVIGFFSVTAYYNFTLNKKVGVACLVMYTFFVAFAILMESNLLFTHEVATCLT